MSEINRFDADKVAEQLEGFKADIYWSNLTPPANIQNILRDVTDQSRLRAFDSETISEYAVLLGAYSAYLTGQENRLTSYVNWCETNIKYIVGKQLADAPGYGFSEKDCYIRANDANAAGLEVKKMQTQAKLDAIKYLSQKMAFLSESLKNLGFEKRKSYHT